MKKFGPMARRWILIVGISTMTMTTGGCTLVDGFASVIYAFSLFWKVAPFVPVSPYFSGEVENAYWEEERYDRVPILDPVEGENAPLFCFDPPSPDEVVRALPDSETGKGGYAFLAETQINNVRMVVEPIVDSIGECRFYPLAGPARLKKCHYKCTVYYDKTLRSDYPIPFTHTDQTTEVVYIDHDHLIRCAGPVVASPSP